MIIIIFIASLVILALSHFYCKIKKKNKDDNVFVCLYPVLLLCLLIFMFFAQSLALYINSVKDAENKLQGYKTEQQNIYTEMESVNMNPESTDVQLTALAEKYPNIPRQSKTLEEYNQELQTLEEQIVELEKATETAKKEIEKLKWLLIPFYKIIE